MASVFDKSGGGLELDYPGSPGFLAPESRGGETDELLAGRSWSRPLFWGVPRGSLVTAVWGSKPTDDGNGQLINDGSRLLSQRQRGKCPTLAATSTAVGVGPVR